MKIPVTVFTGFLGSGKTTIIISILQQVQRDLPGYRIAILKNEFGDSGVDSLLLEVMGNGTSEDDKSKSNVKTVDKSSLGEDDKSTPENVDKSKKPNISVSEMINGCICCVLVGQMEHALQEIKDTFKPDRVIVETSGSAFPAPIAWQIRQMEDFTLDSIVTVVDCLNFKGYEDTSYTAKMQAQYSDLIILNKDNLVTDKRDLDLVLDRVYDLNPDTPKIFNSIPGQLSYKLFFGLDTRLFSLASKSEDKISCCNTSDSQSHSHSHSEVEVIDAFLWENEWVEEGKLLTWLSSLPKDQVFRVKAVLGVKGIGPCTVNHAFGRPCIEPLPPFIKSPKTFAVTLMGLDLLKFKDSLVSALPVKNDTLKHTPQIKP